MLTELFKAMNVRGWCETCGIVFVDVSYEKHLKLHSDDPNNPDKWFVDAFIHACNNPDHIVMTNLPNPRIYKIYGRYEEWNISETIKEQIESKGTTFNDMLVTLYKIREKVRGKPY